MDGKFHNKQKKHIKFLKDWLASIGVESDSKNFFDDYHIDEIDVVFEDKSNWFNGAFELLHLFKNYTKGTEFDIVMCFFLNRTRIKNNIPNNITKKDYDKIMTPPSIYLFKRGNKELETPTDCIAENLSAKYNCKVYFGESPELPPDQQYLYRYLYFIMEN